MLLHKEVSHVTETGGIQRAYYFYPEIELKHAVDIKWMPIKKCSPEECKLLRKNFYKKEIVKQLATNGALNNFFQPSEIEAAQEKGVLPSDYNLHHLLPLEYGGENKLENICVMDKNLHIFLHRRQLDFIRKFLKDGNEIPAYLCVLANRPVIPFEEAHLFFMPQEIEEFKNILKKKEIKKNKAEAKAQNAKQVQITLDQLMQTPPEASLQKIIQRKLLTRINFLPYYTQQASANQKSRE